MGEKEAELAALEGVHLEKVKEKDVLSKTVEQLQSDLDIALKRASEQVTHSLLQYIFHPPLLISFSPFVSPSFSLYLSIYIYVFLKLSLSLS